MAEVKATSQVFSADFEGKPGTGRDGRSNERGCMTALP